MYIYFYIYNISYMDLRDLQVMYKCICIFSRNREVYVHIKCVFFSEGFQGGSNSFLPAN